MITFVYRVFLKAGILDITKILDKIQTKKINPGDLILEYKNFSW
jgi:hypothetical protein